jgi:hypothetical protein
LDSRSRDTGGQGKCSNVLDSDAIIKTPKDIVERVAKVFKE